MMMRSVLPLAGMLGCLLTAVACGNPPADSGAQGPEVVVYKTPTCGCCGKWAEHMRQNGFRVVERIQEDLSDIKASNHVRPSYASCHTALVEGYVVEGHIPAEDVRQLLRQRPDIKGITVPGMPAGSPGMEVGDIRQPYQVLSFNESGITGVFAEH